MIPIQDIRSTLTKQKIKLSYTYISGNTTSKEKKNMAKKNTKFMKMGEAGGKWMSTLNY